MKIVNDNLIQQLFNEYKDYIDRYDFQTWLYENYEIKISNCKHRQTWFEEELTFPSEEGYFLFLMEWS